MKINFEEFIREGEVSKNDPDPLKHVKKYNERINWKVLSPSAKKPYPTGKILNFAGKELDKQKIIFNLNDEEFVFYFEENSINRPFNNKLFQETSEGKLYLGKGFLNKVDDVIILYDKETETFFIEGIEHHIKNMSKIPVKFNSINDYNKFFSTLYESVDRTAATMKSLAKDKIKNFADRDITKFIK
jgi:hypothetical protein